MTSSCLEQLYGNRTALTQTTSVGNKNKDNVIAPIKQMNRKRKRVHFNEDGESVIVNQRVLAIIRPSSEMTPSERNTLWYQKSDLKDGLRCAKGVVCDFGQCASNPASFESGYSDILASTYASCCLDDPDHAQLSNEYATHLALMCSSGDCCRLGECNRGLERVTVPALGWETMRRRKLSIRSIVVAQNELKGPIQPDERSEILRMVSESQTRPAQKFAKALGLCDAMAALVEYQASNDEPVKEKECSTNTALNILEAIATVEAAV